MEAVQTIVSKSLKHRVSIFKEIIWLSRRALKSGELSFNADGLG